MNSSDISSFSLSSKGGSSAAGQGKEERSVEDLALRWAEFGQGSSWQDVSCRADSPFVCQLSEVALEALATLFPAQVLGLSRSQGGRPRMDLGQALRGIFWVLDTGARWADLPEVLGSKSAVHRAFLRLVKEGGLEFFLGQVGRVVKEGTGFGLYECSVCRELFTNRGNLIAFERLRIRPQSRLFVLLDSRGLPLLAAPESVGLAPEVLVARIVDFATQLEVFQRGGLAQGAGSWILEVLARDLASQGVVFLGLPELGGEGAELGFNGSKEGQGWKGDVLEWSPARAITWLQNYRHLCRRWEKGLERKKGKARSRGARQGGGRKASKASGSPFLVSS